MAGLTKETFITTMILYRPTVSAILFAPAVLGADTLNTLSQGARNMDTKIWLYSIMRVHLIVFIVRTIILKQKHFLLKRFQQKHWPKPWIKIRRVSAISEEIQRLKYFMPLRLQKQLLKMLMVEYYEYAGKQMVPYRNLI